MSKTVSKAQVLSLLEGRFDFQSARTVLERTSKQCGLEDKDAIAVNDLSAFCDALEEASSHIASTAEKIRQLGESSSPEKDDAKKNTDKKSTDKTDKKADAKKDAGKKTKK